MVLATLAFLGAVGADQGLLTYFADLSGPGLRYFFWIFGIRFEPRTLIRSSWGRSVSLAFGKVLAADLSDVLVRSVANPRVLLT